MMNQTNLMIVLSSLRPAGTEKFFTTLSNKFSESKDFRVTLFLFSKAPTSYLHNYLSSDILVIESSHSRALSSLPLFLFALYKYRPDVVLSAASHINILAIVSRILIFPFRRFKLYVSERSTLSQMSLYINSFLRSLYLILLSFLYRFPDKVITCSDGVKNDLSSTLSLDFSRISTIYNGYDYVTLKNLSNESSDTLSYLNDSFLNIFSAGRLSPQKDFVTLLRAISYLPSGLPIRLYIAGDGPDRRDLEILAKELDIYHMIIFLGHVSNIMPWLSSTNLFILSSRSEGFPNVLAEAAYLSDCIVSADCPHGPREIFIKTGNKLLFRLGDAKGLATIIEKIYFEENQEIYTNPSINKPIFDLSTTFNDYAKLFQY